MSKANQLVETKGFEKAFPVIFVIADFLPPQALLCWSLTSSAMSTLSKKIYLRLIKQNFSEFLREKELENYDGQNLKNLWNILNLYRLFSAGFHLHRTTNTAKINPISFIYTVRIHQVVLLFIRFSMIITNIWKFYHRVAKAPLITCLIYWHLFRQN
jgi:hypothetical protein